MVPENVHTVSLTLLKFILMFLATLAKKKERGDDLYGLLLEK